MATDPTPSGPAVRLVADVISTFRPMRRFGAGGRDTYVTSLDFDDSGELALVARSDDTLQIYNSKQGKHAKELKSQKYGVHLARFSHHAQSIIYASTKVDDTIRYLSTHDNSYIRYFRGHTGTVTSIALSPSDDNFLSCAKDNTVRLWDCASANYQGMLRISGASLATFDPSATVIAIASRSTQSVLLYDKRNFDKAPFASFDLIDMDRHFLGAQGADWTKLEFTNDGKNLIVGTTGNGHFVLDAFDGKLVHFCHRKAGHSGRLGANGTHPEGASKIPSQGDITTSPDGRFLLGGSGDNGVLIWDLSKPTTPNQVLEPFEQLPFTQKIPILGCHPRTHQLWTADKALTVWTPDQDLMM